MLKCGGFMSKFERKYGKYAVKNLSLALILCYVVGYVVQVISPQFIYMLTLDPYQILHGQIWRLVTWIVVPPSRLDIFTIIMLYFYYSLGTSLERTWGTFYYNVYILGGMICTLIGSFVLMGLSTVLFGDYIAVMGSKLFYQQVAYNFSTYYINMSIFLAFAATFPEVQVLLMFIIPIKMKWMAIVYVALLTFEIVPFSIEIIRNHKQSGCCPCKWVAYHNGR